ncbi:HGR116Cp [Eremothecium sinecaudum]|uniref:Beta-mannosidase B n=1 Tax=Eremothecium sinecaudum TaxID=45286 RepID=A0A120K2S6_9SACH|nr:HGR116Cp [Eremothecium sinecaudum]AMD22455.1 HGR116Cp [Eremothecium sinecaudum]
MQLTNWYYKKHDSNTWVPSHDLDSPTTEIFVDLMHSGVIPDPFQEMNEKHLQWVGQVDWDYRSTFKTPRSSKKSLLRFEGLDTFATVRLNGTIILENENMFEEHLIDVSNYIKHDDYNNKLEITFYSAENKGHELLKESGKSEPPYAWNGDRTRVLIRKATYQYGWDWSPILISCGPYRKIDLIQFEDKWLDKRNVYFHTAFDNDLKCKFDIEIEQDDYNKDIEAIEVKVVDAEENIVCQSISKNGLTVNFNQKFKLWNPVGHGNPYMHRVIITVPSTGQIIEFPYGFRKAELVEEPVPGEDGTSFYFRINNIPVYISGVNWIPPNCFPTVKQDYPQTLQTIIDANMNMARVWGGGVYECDEFMSTCDKMGILVWHDFMFACGQYPADPKFRQTIENEARTQLKRLNKYCSIVAWVGNNEDYQLAESYNLQWDRNDNSGDYTNTNFPARTIYEVDLPSYVSKWTDNVPYHPGSPFSGGDHPTSDLLRGDLHQWNVWHGDERPYQDWDDLAGRFISEFGMLSYGSEKMYKKYCASDLHPQSEVIRMHNKASGGEDILLKYIVLNFRLGDMTLANMVFLSQVMQSDCIALAYKVFRRRWSNKRCGGCLVWQLNDCYPVSSWAVIDYLHIPKLAWYAIKRESEPLTLAINRKSLGRSEADQLRDADHKLDAWFENLEVWVANSTLETRKNLIVEIELYNVGSGTLHKKFSIQVDAAANDITELGDIKGLLNLENNKFIAKGKLLEDGKIIARTSDWPQPLKYVTFDYEATIELSWIDEEEHILGVSANRPVKSLQLSIPTEEDEEIVQFSDNGFDVFPGDLHPVKITSEGTPALVSFVVTKYL